MRKFSLFLGCLSLLAAADGLALLREARTSRRLRLEFGVWQRQGAEIARLSEEKRGRMAREASAEDIARLVRERSEKESDGRRAAARPPHTGFPGRPPSTAAETWPASAWKLAGKGTPRSALTGVLWAATHQDVESLAALLSFDDKTRGPVDAFFAQLPEDTRAQYRSPEKIAATMLAASMPDNLSAATVLSDATNADQATLLLQVQRSDGTQKDTFFHLQRGTDGWSLIVPASVLSAYEQKLAEKP
jgi:hypothetical protein